MAAGPALYMSARDGTGTGRLEASSLQQFNFNTSSQALYTAHGVTETRRGDKHLNVKSTVFASTHGIFIANTFCFIIFASSSYRH